MQFGSYMKEKNFKNITFSLIEIISLSTDSLFLQEKRRKIQIIIKEVDMTIFFSIYSFSIKS
jgi:hypothetical protein